MLSLINEIEYFYAVHLKPTAVSGRFKALAILNKVVRRGIELEENNLLRDDCGIPVFRASSLIPPCRSTSAGKYFLKVMTSTLISSRSSKRK